MKTWKDLKKGDKLWVNGEEGKVKSILETYKDGILDEVIIYTYILTSRLLIGKYTGPTVYLYTPKKDEDKAISLSWAWGILSEKYDTSDDMISGDGRFIISISEQSAKEAKKKLEASERKIKIDGLNNTICELEDEKKELEEKILSSRDKLKHLIELDSEEEKKKLEERILSSRG